MASGRDRRARSASTICCSRSCRCAMYSRSTRCGSSMTAPCAGKIRAGSRREHPLERRRYADRSPPEVRRDPDRRPLHREIAAEQRPRLGVPEAEVIRRMAGRVDRRQRRVASLRCASPSASGLPRHRPLRVALRPRHLQEADVRASARRSPAHRRRGRRGAWVTSTCASAAPASARSSASRWRGSPVPASIERRHAAGISHVQLPAPVIGPGLNA